MFEKIPLNKLYIADYVGETLEYVYGGIYNSTTVIHHFEIKKEKSIFVLVIDEKENFVGYMNLFDNKIYKPIVTSLNDYEVICDNLNIESDKTNDGYINFEPLSNYSSKFIKPFMSVRLAKKAINDINKQREKEKIKSLIFKN